jgi:2-iminobutanoate/2-iminopropanoate deaminase
MFAAATMGDFIVARALSASGDSSVSAELYGRSRALGCGLQRRRAMKRLRVEPISSYLERRRKGPIYPVIVANGFVYLSGLPPFDPATGDIKPATFERQAELVLDQMKLCLEAAGSSLSDVVKCNVYCTPDPSHFAKFNAVYVRYFPTESPARIFLHVPSWPGPFDVEIDCVAVTNSEA